MAKQPTALIILDGFANRESEHGNAVKQAHKPNFDRYYSKYPTTQIGKKWFRRRSSRRPNGQLRSWSYEHWCRTYCLPKFDTYQ